MPKQLTGRFTLIACVLLACLYILFPRFWRGDFSPNVRPGIDMVGGSSLLYQIKGSADGAAPRVDLAEDTIKALRERIDPEGVKNLVWRAQGADKIEIQLPATKESQAAGELRKKYAEAQQAVDALNVRPAQVEAALRLPADQRDAALKALAKGSPARQAVLDELAAIQRRLDDARVRQDAAADAAARIDYDAAMAKLAAANVEVAELDGALASKGERKARLEAIRARDAGNPARAAAIDAYVAAHDKFQTVKNAVGDVGELKTLLKGSGVLSWHIAVKPQDAGIDAVQAMIDRLDRDGPRARRGDEMAWFPVGKADGNAGGNSVAHVHDGSTYVLLWTKPEKSMINREGMQKWTLTGARDEREPSGESVVAFEFDPIGASLFGEMTGRHTPEAPNGPFDIAAVLDGKVISNAGLSSRIGARGQITGGGAGGFSRAELDYLVRTLGAGALPAQLDDEPLVERTVGPQLGADNLRAGFLACVIGIVIVACFLTGYYFLAGVVATLAVLLNILLILAGMSALGATFTLPGVAGIILTIGMAVDSNVLIFERLREEQQRGLSLRLAMRNAYDRAFSAILDSNVTAAITGVILYAIGTEDVRGFGLTLLLGIIASLFTSLFVTKTIFAYLINHRGVTALSSVPLRFPAWDRMLKPNVDWMGKRWMFLGGSAAFIAVGLVLFGTSYAKGRVLDIEFAGGTVVQFTLEQPLPQEAIRDLLEDEKYAGRLDAPSVQAVGDATATADGKPGYKTYEVVTVTSDASQVRGALGEALAGKLDVAQAATFEGANAPLAEAEAADVVEPITAETRQVAGFTPRSLVDHVGGVAIVLRNLTPKLDAADVRGRLDQARLAAAGSFRAYAVEETPDGKGLVILGSDPAAPYDANNPGEWQQGVAAPLWERVNDAVGKPAAFGRVSSINQTIAGETSANAVVALIMSVLLIVIYVWIRFGDLKFGSATVVALVHDVLITLAAIGFAHLLSQTFVGDALLLEPFRLNLTMVSAILTIIGFSMSDTVVVFDRIRENRAVVGHVDAQVVNDSINQTLSRTLLTGGTTLVTLLAMYLTGGPAIHGFTFALFVGLLTGTYSSIAIASPLVLLGATKQQAPAPVGRPATT